MITYGKNTKTEIMEINNDASSGSAVQLVADFCNSEFAAMGRGFLVQHAPQVVLIALMTKSSRITAAFLSAKFKRKFSRRPVEDILARVKAGTIVVTQEQLAEAARQHRSAEHFVKACPSALNPSGNPIEIDESPLPPPPKKAAKKATKKATKQITGPKKAPLHAPAGTAPEGTAPEGTAPEGTAPEGTAPEGTAPEGTAPEGTAPEGTAPEGTAPEGTAPEGTAPEGTAPEGTAPGGIPEELDPLNSQIDAELRVAGLDRIIDE